MRRPRVVAHFSSKVPLAEKGVELAPMESERHEGPRAFVAKPMIMSCCVSRKKTGMICAHSHGRIETINREQGIQSLVWGCGVCVCVCVCVCDKDLGNCDWLAAGRLHISKGKAKLRWVKKKAQGYEL